MKQFKMVTCLFTLVFAFASIPQAQEAVELEKTVVTATRTETPIENLPVSISVITKDDIEKMHAKTVDDVLNKVAGVRVKRNKGLLTTGSHTTVSMRGTGHCSRTLILKDGIPLNTAYIGSVDYWGMMSVDDIEKIEVIRGGSSTLYGSNAMGGVINIITRSAKEKTAGSVSFEGGTFDTYIGNANISTATDRFGVRVAASHKRTDGYEYYEGEKWKDYYKTPEIEITNAAVGGDIWLGESILKVNYEYFFQDSLSTTGTQYDGETQDHKYTLNYSLPIGKIDFNVKSYYFDKSSMSEAYKYTKTTGKHDKYYYSYDVPKDEWGLMMQASTELGSHRLTVGSDLRWGKCESTYKYVVGGRIFGGKEDLYSVFVNDEMLIDDKLILSAGVRYDWWKHHDGRYYNDTKAPATINKRYPEKTDKAWSPKAGVVYKFNEDTKLRASFGTGFKVPSLYHMYKSGPHGKYSFDIPNPDLKAEEMPWSYDFGFDMKPNKNLNLTFTFYHSSFNDFIETKTLKNEEVPPEFDPEPSQTPKQSVNVDEVEIYGVEAGIEVAFNSTWSAFANYTYNKSEIKEYKKLPELEGNYLQYTPRHMTNFGLTYDNPELFTLTLCLRNVGPVFSDLENTTEVDAYQVWDMKISRKLFDGMDVFVSLDNLTDEKYKESSTTYAPPVTVMLGAKYSF